MLRLYWDRYCEIIEFIGSDVFILVKVSIILNYSNENVLSVLVKL